MPVTCMLSHTYHDLRCPVCGEGFLILENAENLVTRTQLRRTVGEALRAQHTELGATGVHTAEPFHVAEDNCGASEWIYSALTFEAESEYALA